VESWLRSIVPARPGRQLDRRPVVLDTILAVGLAVEAVVIILSGEGTFSPDMAIPSGPAQWALAAGAAWAVPFRRVGRPKSSSRPTADVTRANRLQGRRATS